MLFISSPYVSAVCPAGVEYQPLGCVRYFDQDVRAPRETVAIRFGSIDMKAPDDRHTIASQQVTCDPSVKSSLSFAIH